MVNVKTKHTGVLEQEARRPANNTFDHVLSFKNACSNTAPFRFVGDAGNSVRASQKSASKREIPTLV